MSDKPHKKRPRAKTAPAPSFEESLASLEQIVQQLEQGDLGLSESLDCYEQGVQSLKHCYAQLNAAEQRVELLRQVDDDGTIHTEPFEEVEMSLDEKAAARGRRRSTKSKPTAVKTDKRTNNGPDHGVDGSPGLF